MECVFWACTLLNAWFKSWNNFYEWRHWWKVVQLSLIISMITGRQHADATEICLNLLVLIILLIMLLDLSNGKYVKMVLTSRNSFGTWHSKAMFWYLVGETFILTLQRLTLDTLWDFVWCFIFCFVALDEKVKKYKQVCWMRYQIHFTMLEYKINYGIDVQNVVQIV